MFVEADVSKLLLIANTVSTPLSICPFAPPSDASCQTCCIRCSRSTISRGTRPDNPQGRETLRGYTVAVWHSRGFNPKDDFGDCFRLDHLPNDSVGTNLRRLLTEVGKRADWSQPLPAGTGRGMACCGMSGSLITAVVEVSVVARDIHVRRVVVCVDPGLVINPAGAKLQITGGIMMGISSALYERITFSQGMADQHSFDDYALLKPHQAPPIDVHLMGTGDIPAGLGEPGVGPVAAAIGNAVFSAARIRVRSLPIELP
jgi:hypothetical protein